METVLHAVCPSMQEGADGYAGPTPDAQREALARCYRSLLDAFNSLRRR